MWADTVNKIFYLYGGEDTDTPSTPDPAKLWAFDVLYQQWNETASDTSEISQASFGAGVTVNDTALGYYYGGWLNDNSVPDWSGARQAVSILLVFDMIDHTGHYKSGPPVQSPRTGGVMLHVPVSNRGMLVHFGGIQLPYGYGNGNWKGVSHRRRYVFVNW